MILDTDFLVNLIQGDKEAHRKAEELEEKDIQQKISTATVFELYNGVVRADKPEEEKQKVMKVVDSKQELDATSEIMKKAGKIHGKQINKGKRLPSFDTIIGATAIVHEETLLTRDKTDFQRIKGVNIQTY